jgi:hypothetical protein
MENAEKCPFNEMIHKVLEEAADDIMKGNDIGEIFNDLETELINLWNTRSQPEKGENEKINRISLHSVMTGEIPIPGNPLPAPLATEETALNESYKKYCEAMKEDFERWCKSDKVKQEKEEKVK